MAEKAREFEKPVVFAKFDVRKAFDRVPHSLFLQALKDRGVPLNVCCAWARCILGSTYKFRMPDGTYSSAVLQQRGVRQWGCQ
jgi:hypothetical protein